MNLALNRINTFDNQEPIAVFVIHWNSSFKSVFEKINVLGGE